ncbi:MoaD/ThiS family protein [Dermabacteraceae bacterium P9123]
MSENHATPGGAQAPRVHLRFFAAAAAAVGRNELDVSAGTVAAALEAATAQAQGPDAARVLANCSVLLNEVSCEDPQRALSDGDRLDLLPPFAGG